MGYTEISRSGFWGPPLIVCHLHCRQRRGHVDQSPRTLNCIIQVKSVGTVSAVSTVIQSPSGLPGSHPAPRLRHGTTMHHARHQFRREGPASTAKPSRRQATRAKAVHTTRSHLLQLELVGLEVGVHPRPQVVGAQLRGPGHPSVLRGKVRRRGGGAVAGGHEGGTVGAAR
jgi:hypothetical protein